jgi:hypothetical protein
MEMGPAGNWGAVELMDRCGDSKRDEKMRGRCTVEKHDLGRNTPH